MKEKNKEKLLNLLNDRKNKVDKLSDLRKDNVNKREQFLQGFEQLAKSSIEPLMLKFAEEIQPFGHYVHI